MYILICIPYLHLCTLTLSLLINVFSNMHPIFLNLLGDEYVLCILSHFNAQVVVKMSQIYHLKSFLQFFLYGCNIVFIVPFYQQIIYIHHKICTNFANFLEKKSHIIKIKVLKIYFIRCLVIFSYQACSVCFRPYKNLMSLQTFYSCPSQ